MPNHDNEILLVEGSNNQNDKDNDNEMKLFVQTEESLENH